MGVNCIDWQRIRNKTVVIVDVDEKLSINALNGKQLTALDAKLEVLNAMANNLLGANHFSLATEYSDVEVGELA